MDIYIVSDIHGNYPYFEKILNNVNKEVKAILINGDIFNNYSEKIEKVIKKFHKNNPNIEVHVIPGSHESKGDYKHFIDNLEEIITDHSDGEIYKLGEINILPLPGSETHPNNVNKEYFNINYETLESELKNISEKVIIQSHDPPHGYGDISAFIITPDRKFIPAAVMGLLGYLKELFKEGKIKIEDAFLLNRVGVLHLNHHIGGEKLIYIIKKYQEKISLVSCGHIHENIYFEKEIPKIENIPIVNTGPAIEGYYTILNLNDNKITITRKKIE